MLNERWPLFPIETIYTGLYDGPHATPDPAEEGPIFLGIKNITEDGRLDLSDIRHISETEFPNWTRRVMPQAGDIVFTYEATLNRYAIIPKGFRGCLGRRLALIRPDSSKVDTKYLFYYFFSDEWRRIIANNLTLGSTVDRIPLISFPKFKVRVPPLPIQRTIASILCAYDELIENNTRRIAVLEETARLLYQEWFVKFRFPGHEEVKMVESALGMVPEGWEVVTLGTLANETRRGVNPETIDSETPYFGLEHLPRRSIALSEWGIAQDVQSTKLSFQKNDILFGKIRPYLHKVGVAPLNGVCSSDTIVISPKQEKYFGLVLCCVSSDSFVYHANKTSQGTQMPRANWSILTKYLLALPPEPLLTLFDETIHSFVIAIHNWIFHNRVLRRTRDKLLPKLVSGEINVSGWVEEEAREVVYEMARAGGRALKVAEETRPVEQVAREGMEWRSLWE